MRQTAMDQSNFLVIKARLGDDVRKVPIQNFDITRDELLLMLQRIFKGQLSHNDTILLKYRDDDNDLVTIGDDSDLTFAIRCHQTLRLSVTVKDAGGRGVEGYEAEKLREELAGIRDTANRLLDSLQLSQPSPPTLNGHPEEAEEPQPVKEPAPSKPIKAELDEFDPLQAAHNAPYAQGPPVPTTPTAPAPAKDTSQPPSVYGMGHHESSRPDTPSSQTSNRTGQQSLDASLNHSSGHFQQQENVATITPTLHQQVNAGGAVGAPPSLNGPPQPTPFQTPPPSSIPAPTPPPPPAASVFGAPPPPPTSMYPAPTSTHYGGPPPTYAHQPPMSAPQPPMGSTPTPPAPPTQPPTSFGQHPQPPSNNPPASNNPPPSSHPPTSAGGYYGQPPQMSGYPPMPPSVVSSYSGPTASVSTGYAPPPPSSAHSATSYAPPPPPAGGYGAPPVGPPPMGPPSGMGGGANPFARGLGASGYPRPPSFYPPAQ